MVDTRKVLKIFLASPSDLPEERRAVDQITGADPIRAAGYLPQVVAGLYNIGLPRSQFCGGSLRQGHDDALHDASVFSQPKGVVDEINGQFANALGYHVELVGWEDTISGYGRPQAII